jgi:hypothetical protein
MVSIEAGMWRGFTFQAELRRRADLFVQEFCDTMGEIPDVPT